MSRTNSCNNCRMNNSYDNMNNRGSSGYNTSGCGCDNHNVPGSAGVALGYGKLASD